ncbi:MAG: hypothetical protein FJW36_05290 [Acidobacteria bacterium]|nr:hypothetical protein [Acidobacteriota bacterium]
MHRRQLFTLLAPALLLRASEARIRVRIQATRKGKSAAANDSRSLEIVLISNEPFPIRALDPVLKVGDVYLDNYRFSGEHNEILTFFTLGNEDLRPGSLMVLQYGNDRPSRNEVGNFSAPQ